MEKYEQISIVGEGSYGLVLKCRHKETDQIVAIKKFLETEEDAIIRKMALREIRMLKRLKHENLVAMIEVFRHRKRFYLVFEYLEGTVLDELEKMSSGLGDERSRERIYQVIRAINYCHNNQIIHRDVKPENVLVSSLGVVKLCDFGFARLVSITGEPCTEYVATRWYRAPELLVGESNYGPAVDIWAIGCLFAEMMTGDPLFPGQSDIDQLYLIVKMLGKPSSRHQHLMAKNSQLRGITKSATNDTNLYKNFPHWSDLALEFLEVCIKMDPLERYTSDELLKISYFTHDRFPLKFLPALRDKVNKEFNNNPLLRKFKSDILLSTDKSYETKQNNPRGKLLQNEQVRWKLYMETSTNKRKHSGGDFIGEIDKNLLRSNAKLAIPKGNLPKSRLKNAEILEKSLESLVKSRNSRSNTPESNFGFGDCNKSPNRTNILHPSINNISFNQPKKSPNFMQSLASFAKNASYLGNNRQFLKRIDNQDSSPIGSWLNSFPSNLHRKKEYKEKKSDDFTLPNLPGITSPLRNKKKSLPELELQLNQDTRTQSATSA